MWNVKVPWLFLFLKNPFVAQLGFFLQVIDHFFIRFHRGQIDQFYFAVFVGLMRWSKLVQCSGGYCWTSRWTNQVWIQKNEFKQFFKVLDTPYLFF
jgi:hypothetical protein